MNDDNALVSVVLLNYNGEKFIDTCSPSLFNIDYSNYEIIFVDNGSKDKSVDKFRKLSEDYPSIKVHEVLLKENIGYSKANNHGIKYANGKYLVLLSNDIKVDVMWLTNMISILESDKKIGLAQSMMYSLYNKNEPDKMGNYIDSIGFNYSYKPTEKIEEVFYSEGAVMFIRKSVLNETYGLFDKDFFMFYEDIDFSWRVRLRGYKIVVVPSSKVYHARGGTVLGVIMKPQPLYVYHNTKNRLITLYKNYNAFNVLKYVPAAIFIEFLKCIYLLLKINRKSSFSCFKAIIYFITNIPQIHKKRKLVQSIRLIDDNDIKKYMYTNSFFSSFKYLYGESKKLSRELV